MQSVTIKDPSTGCKLLKISHGKKGYLVESRGDIKDFDCLIVLSTKERITIPVRRQRGLDEMP